MARIGFDPATANHSSPQFKLGAEYENDGKIYRYVKVVDLDTAAGDVVMITATAWNVTKDYTGGTAHLNMVAGVAPGVITAGNYGFILIRGYTSTINCDGSTAAGSRLTLPATADGRADLAADPTTVDPTQAQLLALARVFAIASAADSSNIAPGYVDVRI